MQSDKNLFNEASVNKAIQLANSSEGKKLLGILQSTKGNELDIVMNEAANGNYDQVKSMLSSLLREKEIQDIVRKIGDK